MADSVVNPSSPSDSSLADPPASSDPNIIPRDQSANDVANRPISTISADLSGEASAKSGSQTEPESPLADSPVATASASTPDQPITADSEPSISIDQSANATSAPTADTSVTPTENTPTPQLQEEVPVSSPVSQITQTEPISGGSIQDLSQSN